MALYENLLTQAGGRQSGSPVTRPTFGGSVQPSQPNYPAPPSPPAGVTGRPSSRPVMPSPPVAGPASTAPAVPDSSPAAPPTTGGPKRYGIPEGNPQTQQPVAPAAPPPDPMKQQMRTGAPGGAPTAALSGGQAGPALTVNRVPTSSDHVGLLPGVAIRSPYGTHTMGSDGKPAVTFDSPEHEMRYKTDEANYAGQLSTGPLSGFPGAPRQPATLGRPAYDVWSGSWIQPNAQ